MQIKKVPTKDLISPEWNPRQITNEELEKLKTSLEEFGYIEPIIINDVNNHVVGGNQRLRALIALGYDEVDCVYVHIEDINKEKACNVALNKISGEWDNDKLRVVLEEIELSPIDIKLTGFDEIELTDMSITEDNIYNEELSEHEQDTYAGGLTEEEVTVVYGEIYQLGNHVLMCGDSENKDCINKLINETNIDLLFTDPPYGINVVSTSGNIGGGGKLGFVGAEGIVGANKYKPILNDDKPYDPSLLVELNVPSIIWGANNFSSKLEDNAKWLVWYKKPEDGNSNTFSDVELAWTNLKGKSCKLYKYLWSGLVREGERRLELKERVHPTQKPVGLLINILNDYSEPNDNILDLYGGSGSTLIACEEINRNCFMMELDPYYCQVIINRWEEYTGRKAEKLPL